MILTDVAELKKPNENASPEEAKEIIAQLEAELAPMQPRGIGLAAPQIGIHKRVAIIRTSKHSLDLVNPRIVAKGKNMLSEGESCLSLPGESRNIWRSGELLMVSDLDSAGVIVTGLHAVAVQHEMDHLDGILITDRAIGAVGRNDPCPCGKTVHGKRVKFKKCHGR